LDGRRWSLRREEVLEMADDRTPWTERARAATVAQTASVCGNVAAEARRAALLFKGSAEVVGVAEPQGTQRLTPLGLEEGLDAAQTASIFTGVVVEARRVALLCSSSTEALDVAEPPRTQRPAHFGSEEDMDVEEEACRYGAGAHFENLESSGGGRARRECNRPGRADVVTFLSDSAGALT